MQRQQERLQLAHERQLVMLQPLRAPRVQRHSQQREQQRLETQPEVQASRQPLQRRHPASLARRLRLQRPAEQHHHRRQRQTQTQLPRRQLAGKPRRPHLRKLARRLAKRRQHRQFQRQTMTQRFQERSAARLQLARRQHPSASLEKPHRNLAQSAPARDQNEQRTLLPRQTGSLPADGSAKQPRAQAKRCPHRRCYLSVIQMLQQAKGAAKLPKPLEEP